MHVYTDGVFVITGGGGALAGAVAAELAGAGARLALVDLRREAVEARARELGALPLAADLTRPEEAQRMVAETTAALGGVDGLIHTAGGFAMAPAEALDPELYDRLLDVNLRTLVNAVGATLPGMLAAGRGFVAGIAAGVVPNGGAAGMSLYAAAKGAVALYLRSVAREVRGRGVRVLVVYPMTSIDTAANRAAEPDADFETWVDAAEIGRALLFAATRSHRGGLEELKVHAG